MFIEGKEVDLKVVYDFHDPNLLVIPGSLALNAI
jgi:hypothetical protein